MAAFEFRPTAEAHAERIRRLVEDAVRDSLECREGGLAYLAARCLETWGCRPDEIELVEERRGDALHWYFRQRPGSPAEPANERSE
jgi:hypothetical protein